MMTNIGSVICDVIFSVSQNIPISFSDELVMWPTAAWCHIHFGRIPYVVYEVCCHLCPNYWFL